ncbi:zinc iron permease [Boletus edulis]|uniref:Zinc/iron permease n=1 Tax=Boletus edulis BED1 TaxID=1328754 RepID=A0AAD4G9G0_BOLED|nr:zinc iron permease [Boletus edulis]KAF8429968.1 Zinc/iron permease [Boletus edulis BED1]
MSSQMSVPVIADKDDPCFHEFLTEPATEALYFRVVATLFIFVVSLFAVSFPALSKRISVLRIPRIIFFIGKHFGTGVILSTAFVHLLQDSFEALRSPLVRARWKVGDWVGLIVLCSLLAIFLVEYVSTSFVNQLHSYSSPSSSIASTPRDESPVDIERGPPSRFPDAHHPNPEQTPLIGTADSHHPPSHHRHTQDSSYGAVQHHVTTHSLVNGDASEYFEGHHRHESRSSHLSHHERTRPTTMYGLPTIADDRPSDVGHAHCIESGHHHHGLEDTVDATGRHEDKIRIGKKRQIVGILVLQLGIMIHSLVIGLTLSITSGPDFTTLLTALTFHQLFEGLSLGIRVASLPSPREPEFKYLSILKPTLAFLFAITTPLGILLGMLTFAHNDDMAHLRLTQGIMSAISAGLLIYAACVEMLAGDFVMDPILWQSGVGKQALALFSLAAGVTLMALVGS